jgi:hypothetical protein
VVGPGNVFSKFVSATDLSLTSLFSCFVLFCFVFACWVYVGAKFPWEQRPEGPVEAWNGVSLPLTADVEVKGQFFSAEACAEMA